LPYLIRVYGSELWNYANSPRTAMADFDAAQVLVRDQYEAVKQRAAQDMRPVAQAMRYALRKYARGSQAADRDQKTKAANIARPFSR
jgi:hypothetical protein